MMATESPGQAALESLAQEQTEPPAAEAAAPAGMEDCVPVEALAMPDEREAMQTPAVGDKVEYSVEGTVTRIEGGQAYVRKSAVNGQAVPETPAPPKPEAPDDYAALEDEARAMQD